MKNEYIITNEELTEKGLNLNDYALTPAFVPALINFALDIAISRVCELGDNLDGENDIESVLDSKPEKVGAFKKVQFRVLWNLLFTATESPTDLFVDSVIAHELNIGKINGVQKGLYYRHN